MSKFAATVYRYGDKVAIRLANNETIYLTRDESSQMAVLLQAASEDIQARAFTKSQFATGVVHWQQPCYGSIDGLHRDEKC